MAKEASMCLFFLSFLIVCCSCTLAGFSYHEKGDTAALTSNGTSFFQKNKISQSQIQFFVADHKILSTLTSFNVSVDFFLNKSLAGNFIASKSSVVSWRKAHVVRFFPQADIRSIIASCDSECLGQNEMPLLLSVIKSIHSALSKLHITKDVKVSVAFPLLFLEKLNESYQNDLLRIVWFIKKINSFIMIEDSIDGESSMGENLVQTVVRRATLAASVLPCKDVPLVMTIKSPIVTSLTEFAQFSEAVSEYLEPISRITKRMVALYAEVQKTEDFAQKEIFPLSQRESLSKVHIRRILDDTSNPPTTVSPTNPTTPVITPPADTPTIITVPATNPVTVSPTNPGAVPVTVPSTTPVPTAPTNPANSPVPVTNPATTPITVPGAQPSTNPVASYPPPSGTVPVTNTQPPPASTNGPAIQGQSWCVAKTGAPETTLQSALDYACGTSSVDCSQIQPGGSCYNPNSVQNHASFAFNSYYQKNPAPTSCDFGGAATIVNTNPSTGSCIYPSSSGAATSGSGAPASAFGFQSPPDVNTSHSAGLRPSLGCLVLLISLATGRLSMTQ